MTWLTIATLGMGCSAGAGDSPEPRHPPGRWVRGTVSAFGRTWSVRDAAEPEGAGPNRWSAARVAALGPNAVRLTLGRGDRGDWDAAEMATPIRGHGTLRLVVEGPVGALPPDVVFGAFLYRDDASEIDIELARWGDPDEATAGQFVVAPPGPGRLQRFSIDPGARRVELALRWRPEDVTFAADDGRGWRRFRFTGPGRPIPNAHWLHLNLWAHRGRRPPRAAPVSLVVRDLRYD